MTEKKPTLRTMAEFSRACGISRPTLSKYFHNPDTVSSRIRKEIEAALEEHDFNPSFFATNMNRNTTRNIGILVPILSDPFYAEMVRQFENKCVEAGYWAIVMSSHGHAEIEVRAIQTLLSMRVAGAIVAPVGYASDIKALERLKNNTPTVIFDSPVNGFSPYVGSDNVQSTSLMTDYLCRSGSPPVFMGIPPVNENAELRQQGYSRQMEKNGFEPCFTQTSKSTWDFERVGFRIMSEMIAENDCQGMTIMCASDRLAFGAMSAAFGHGLKIGRDPDANIRIAGHDDHPLSRYMNPPLTTVVQDYATMAQRSFEILSEAMKDESTADLPKVTLVETVLEMRESA